MFDSKNPGIARLLDKSRQDVERATRALQQTTTVLGALPEGIPEPTDVRLFGYCADASLDFQGPDALALLLDKLPPLEVVALMSFEVTQKPVTYLRDQERQYADYLPVFPVVFKQGKACWWTRLAGLTVAVTLQDYALSELPVLATSYEQRSQSYNNGSSTTYFQRRLAPVAATPLALASWIEDWESFGTSWMADWDAQGAEWKSNPLHVLKSCRSLIVARAAAGAAFDRSVLPVAVQTSAWRAANLTSPFSPLFTDEQADQVAAFCQQQWDRFLAAHSTEREQLARGAEWLTAFLADKGGFHADLPEHPARLVHLLRFGTGLDLEFSWVKCGRGGWDIRLKGSCPESFQDVQLPLNPEAPALRIQDYPVSYC